MDYPPSLLAKLSSDELALGLSLGSDAPAASSIPLSRDVASRRLQAATPIAIQTLETICKTGDDKTRVAAASKLLDLSPVRDLAPSQTSSLPPELLAPLISALSSFASAAMGSLRSPDLDPDAIGALRAPLTPSSSDIVQTPEPVLAPRRKKEKS